jgi:ATP adenylyltransferase/5',5'''-P-1,P-4-tetraphosphate phosphorylase II
MAKCPSRRLVSAAEFENGTAEITRGDISTGNSVLQLIGLVPYDRGSLALSAVSGRRRRLLQRSKPR